MSGQTVSGQTAIGKTSSGQTQSKVSPARAAAFRILLQVEVEERHADDLLHGAALHSLAARDRALATTLVMGTLRWQMALDAAIAPLLRESYSLAPEIWVALRMGLLQLWYLDRIPAHAALLESVELVKEHGLQGLAGLVNAVLRKLSRQPAPVRAKAALAAHPAWMVERWRVLYGDATAQKICEADQEIPVAALRRDPQHASFEGLLPGRLLTAAALWTESETYVQNQLRIQDEGSQLVAEIAVAAVAGLGAGRVLDACAAPGGKTAVLAELLPASEVIACDISASRLRTTQRLLRDRAFENIQFVLADAAGLPATAPFDAPFELVLCDVPCTGTGTLARNPEIRLRLQRAQFSRYVQKQLHILKSCWERVTPGGVLVYSTCSLEPEENAGVVEMFRRAVPDASLAPVATVIESLRDAGRMTEPGAELLLASAIQGDFLRTLPGLHPCDGFFVAVLRKPA